MVNTELSVCFIIPEKSDDVFAFILLISISNESLIITELGKNFAPQIANVFDKYDPPSVTYNERLQRINKVAVHPS